MQARFVNEKSEALLEPFGALWKSAEAQDFQLIGTPLALQPTAYIRKEWADRPIGAVQQIRAAALHNGRHLAFRLNWQDPNKDDTIIDNDEFCDAAAVFLPTHEDSPLFMMGSPELPVNMWYWRADQETGRHVVATGIGTTETIDEEQVVVSSDWRNGEWTVVIARALTVDSRHPLVQVAAGQSVKFSLAVWEGSKQERAGLKAILPNYVDLQISPSV